MPNQGTTIQAKGLTILEDQLSHEFLACKKAEEHAAQFTDVQLRGLAQDIANAHQTRYNRLLDYLNGHC